MDYEKKYKEAIELMKDCIPDADGLVHVRPQDILHELEESEDEKTRNFIIKVFKDSQRDGISETIMPEQYDKIFAWLEKQGEKKPAFETKTPEESLGVYSDTYNKIVDECIYGEQKPADKVEPKFKVGDFIVNDYCMGKVIELTSDAYLLDTGQGIPFSYEHNAHLWTIQDAKDGDVLVHNGCTFIFMGIKDDIVQAIEENILEPVSFGEPDKDNDYHPATKEQREILFQKMKEAGYKWDADKKELKKIEPKTEWLKELQERLNSLSKEDFEKVMAKYRRYGEEGSVDYDKLNTMLDESLSTETKESWNKRLGKEPASDYLKTEIDKYIIDNFTVDREVLIRLGIVEKDYIYSMDKSDMLALVEHFTNWQKQKEEPVSEDLEEACEQLAEKARMHKAETISPFFSQTDYKQGVIDGAKWQKANLWKPADGDDLPEIDREVIVLLDNGRVGFAHRPPEYWNGKNIITGKVTRHYPKTYDKGGWNMPNIKYWLDIELPKEIEL